MNETLKTIATRYSCRSFTSEPVPGTMLEAIALAAVQAPSGMNRQAWRTVVVTDKQLIDDLEAEGMRVLSAMDDKSAYERIMSRGGKLFYNAQCIVFLPITDGAALDCGIITENIALAATSLGLGNVICGLAGLAFTGSKAAEFKQRLQFPDGFEFGMSVLLGYAANESEPHVPDMDKIIYVK